MKSSSVETCATNVPHHEVQPDDDMSALTPRQLADYHFAVTALQLDGHEVFLSPGLRDNASEITERTHYDLLVASGDALSKELLPGPDGYTIGNYLPIRQGFDSIINDPILQDRYSNYFSLVPLKSSGAV